MSIYGLVGYPLSHSRSAEYFSDRFKNTGNVYKLFPLPDLNEFPALIRNNPGLCGLNITIPYKEKIIPFLDDLDGQSNAIMAVNTILITRDKEHTRLTGYNTDAEGFRKSADFKGYTHALILGTGGAAKAVAYALGQMGISSRFVSRSASNPTTINYQVITQEILNKCLLIINATPLGMFPDTGSFPELPYRFLSDSHFLYDLVYNPEETMFLKKGKEAGARVQNGLEMLKIQAELSYNIWTPGGR